MVTPSRRWQSGPRRCTGACRTWSIKNHHDGLVINGTTGESATRPTKRIATWSPQWSRPSAIAPGWWPVLARTTPHTPFRAPSCGRSRCAWSHGSRPVLQPTPQEGLITHFHAIADAQTCSFDV